jgi:hypothetical protein
VEIKMVINKNVLKKIIGLVLAIGLLTLPVMYINKVNLSAVTEMNDFNRMSFLNDEYEKGECPKCLVEITDAAKKGHAMSLFLFYMANGHGVDSVEVLGLGAMIKEQRNMVWYVLKKPESYYGIRIENTWSDLYHRNLKMFGLG